jgi:hypothetical protein
MHVAAELAVGCLRPEGKQEIAEAPVGLAGPGFAVAGVLRAPRRFGEVILGGSVGDGVPDGLVLV